MVDILIRAAPHKGRTERERAQADEIYGAGRAFRVCFTCVYVTTTLMLVMHWIDTNAKGALARTCDSTDRRLRAPVSTLYTRQYVRMALSSTDTGPRDRR